MSFIQTIRASHLNRHGFIDVAVGLVVFQATYITLVILFCNLENVSTDKAPTSLGRFIFLALFIAPYFENLLLIGFATIHEKLLKRAGLFVVAPLLLTALHFITPKQLPFPIFIRALTLFVYFYIFLKQYDLHKTEMGKHKALLLSSSLHFLANGTSTLIASLLDPDIAAETIFSAQPGE